MRLLWRWSPRVHQACQTLPKICAKLLPPLLHPYIHGQHWAKAGMGGWWLSDVQNRHRNLVKKRSYWHAVATILAPVGRCVGEQKRGDKHTQKPLRFLGFLRFVASTTPSSSPMHTLAAKA